MEYPDIYIMGNKQSGKSTIAKFLEKEYGYARISFADPLKNIAAYIFKLLTGVNEDISSIVSKINNGTYPKDGKFNINGFEFPSGVRPILQGIGEGCRKYMDDLVWVDLALDSLRTPQDTPVVIDDCRYPNECEILRYSGYKGIFINRPGTDGDHISEKSQHNYDNKLINVDLVVDYADGEKAVLNKVRTYLYSVMTNTNELT